MKLDNLVIEELSRMKSLFGYERGKVISEQKLDEDTTTGLGYGDALINKTPAADTAAAKNNTMSAEDRQFYVNKEFCSQKNGIVPQRTIGGYLNIPKHKFSDAVKIYKITDSEIKAAQATCPDVKTQQTNSTPKPPPIPSELKDVNGVKKFQDWLDSNKAGWATGYANNILNKTGTGYGRMGPRTTKAWGLFKDEYMNPQKLGFDVPDITTQQIQQINTGIQPAQQTPTQQTPAQPTQKSPQPPTEPGEPGEERDGWTFDEKRQTWY
jgi:hypothetical protein